MNKKLFGSLDVSSSQDPTKLSASVSGIILTFSSLIIFGAARFGIPLVDAQVSAFATQAGLAVGSLWFLYGVIRKGINRLSW